MNIDSNQNSGDGESQRGMPDYDYKIGLLRLNRFTEQIEPEPVIVLKVFIEIEFFFNIFIKIKRL